MKLLRLLALLLMLPLAAHAAQSNFVTGNFPTASPYPGLTLVNNINTAMTALSSNNSGATAPSYLASNMIWENTTAHVLEFSPDGSNSYPMGYNSGGWIAMSAGFQQLAIASTGSANAYVVTYSPAAIAYVTGQVYSFIANFANTGAATANVNTIGAKAIKKYGGTALASGDIANGQVAYLLYDGTNLQLLNPTANTVDNVASANIALLNAANVFTAKQGITPTTLTVSSHTFTPTAGTANTFQFTLETSSCSCTVANPSGTINAGDEFGLDIRQPASGGPATVSSWGSYYIFSGGTAPTLTATANYIDTVTCRAWDSTHLNCTSVGNFAH